MSRPVEQGKWDTGRYHECWYPVALSTEVGVGDVIGRDVMDGRIALYRTADDQVHAVSAYCRHLGADLALGDLVDGNLRCPFHHWSYGGDGRCSNIASGDRIPKSANLFAFPVSEQYGLVWIFFGPKPLYEPPTFPPFDRTRMLTRAFQVEMHANLMCDPWLFAANVFDFQHLKVLHRMDCEAEALRSTERSMGYRFTEPDGPAGRVELDFTVWGTNTVLSTGSIGGRQSWHIAGGTSFTGTDAGARFFFVLTAACDPDDDDSVEAATKLLDTMEGHHTTIVNEDIPVLNSLQLDHRILVKSDRTLAKYFKYAESYPKRSFGELEALASGERSYTIASPRSKEAKVS